MEAALAKALRVNVADAGRFISENGGAESAALAVLGWTQDTRPIPLAMKRVEEEAIVRRALIIERLRPWSSKYPAAHGVHGFLAGVSLFELDATLQYNLTYPCLAFSGVTLAACMELAQFLKVTLDQPLLVYAVAFHEIKQRRTSTRDDIDAALGKMGLPYVDPTTLVPFPSDIFEDHPLRNINVDEVQLSDVMMMLPTRGFSAMREKKEMRNRIVKCVVDGKELFTLSNGRSQFVRLIRRQNISVAEWERKNLR